MLKKSSRQFFSRCEASTVKHKQPKYLPNQPVSQKISHFQAIKEHMYGDPAEHPAVLQMNTCWVTMGEQRNFVFVSLFPSSVTRLLSSSENKLPRDSLKTKHPFSLLFPLLPPSQCLVSYHGGWM